MEPIYQQIMAAIGPDGTLPGNFRVKTTGMDRRTMILDEGPLAGKEIHYAEGALDGITYYHGSGSQDEALLEGLQEVILLAAKEQQFEDALEKLHNCFEEHDGMLGCVDGLQEWIFEHKDELNLSVLFHLSCTLLTDSCRIGEVKYALSVLELFAGAEGEWRDHVRTLALSDEFTLFCVFVANQWENKSEELFAMARNTRGWGRVHAVRELEPTTQEMKDWLLDEGWDNDVMPAYTAKACAEKGGLLWDRLSQPMDRTQLDAAGGLVLALLEEGPVRNISVMEDGLAILMAYLAQVQWAKPDFSDQDRQVVQEIVERTEADSQLGKRARQVMELLS